MGDGIKFSILTSAYNAKSTIMHSVNSVLMQTYGNFEYIILENGSTDNETRKFIQDKVENLDNRIKVIYIDENVGWMKGTSICLKEATGDYMTMLAADDYFTDEKALEYISEEASKNPDIVFIGYCVSTYNQENGAFEIKSIGNNRNFEMQNEKKLYQLALVMMQTYYNSMFHFEKISFLKKHNIDFFSPFWSDCEGMTEAIAHAEHIIGIDKPLYALTYNTSQTRGNVSGSSFGDMQWKSVINAILRDGYFDACCFGFIAVRIADNDFSRIQGACDELPIRDKLMHTMNVERSELRDMIEAWISTEEFRDRLVALHVVSTQMDGVTAIIECLDSELLKFTADFSDDKRLNLELNINDYYSFIIKYLDYAYKMKMDTECDGYLKLIEYCLDIVDKVENDLSFEQKNELKISLERFK